MPRFTVFAPFGAPTQAEEQFGVESALLNRRLAAERERAGWDRDLGLQQLQFEREKWGQQWPFMKEQALGDIGLRRQALAAQQDIEAQRLALSRYGLESEERGRGETLSAEERWRMAQLGESKATREAAEKRAQEQLGEARAGREWEQGMGERKFAMEERAFGIQEEAQKAARELDKVRLSLETGGAYDPATGQLRPDFYDDARYAKELENYLALLQIRAQMEEAGIAPEEALAGAPPSVQKRAGGVFAAQPGRFKGAQKRTREMSKIADLLPTFAGVLGPQYQAKVDAETYASDADEKEAAKSAVEAMVDRMRGMGIVGQDAEDAVDYMFDSGLIEEFVSKVASDADWPGAREALRGWAKQRTLIGRK